MYFKRLIEDNLYRLEKKKLKIRTNVHSEIINLLRQDSTDSMKVFLLLKTFPNFDHFLSYYQIPEDIMRTSLFHMQVCNYSENETIINMGDPSDAFYIIIQGNVVIRERIFNSNGEDFIKDKLVLGEGSCFGEFGLLYHQPRGQSIVSLGNTVLFKMSQQQFNSFFYTHMHKTENGRKSVIMNLIPCFKKISKKTFLLLYKNFIFIKVTKTNYIFKEGDNADFICLIVNGRARLKKNNYNLIYISKNDLVGLEAIEPIQTQFKCSLIAIDDCFVIKIRMSILGNIIAQFRECLMEMKNATDKFIDNLINQNEIQKEKFKITYRETDIRKRINFICKGTMNIKPPAKIKNKKQILNREIKHELKHIESDTKCVIEKKVKRNTIYLNLSKISNNINNTFWKQAERHNLRIVKTPSSRNSLSSSKEKERPLTMRIQTTESLFKTKRKINSVINIIHIPKTDSVFTTQPQNGYHHSEYSNIDIINSARSFSPRYRFKHNTLYNSGAFDLPLVTQL